MDGGLTLAWDDEHSSERWLPGLLLCHDESRRVRRAPGDESQLPKRKSAPPAASHARPFLRRL